MTVLRRRDVHDCIMSCLSVCVANLSCEKTKTQKVKCMYTSTQQILVYKSERIRSQFGSLDALIM